MNYNLTTIRPKGFLHASAFAEVKDSLAWALQALGHNAGVTENWIDAKDTNIIFGSELLAPNQPQALPSGTIIYNLEQPTHPNMGKVKSIVMGSKCKVWDYSKTNFEMWRELGADCHYVPIGYTPNLTRIPKAENQDIDVLFLGWLTPRRMEVIQSLKAAGLKVVASDKCYGGGRDNLISRARICLNWHHDGRNLFEVVRISYYLANGKTVFTERSSDDDDYADIRNCLMFVDEFTVVNSCLEELRRQGELNWEWTHAEFRARDYVATVRSALTELTPQGKVAARYAKGSPDIGHYMEFLKEKAHGTCLEIGVRDGASTSALLSGVEKNGGVVLSVDIDGSCAPLFAGHPQWKFIQSSSANPKLRVPGLDVLFIDGDHTREGFRADLERFYPLVKPGGLILCHDVTPEPGQTLEDVPGSDYPSVAVREEFLNFFHERGITPAIMEGKYGLGTAIKPEVIESEESWQASEALLA